MTRRTRSKAKADNTKSPQKAARNGDNLTQLSQKYWDPSTEGNHQPYEAAIIEEIYQNEICLSENSNRRIALLEFSQYLELYLWPNYVAGESTHAHALSIVVMMNEKTRERISGWHIFESSNQEQFSGFFHQIMEICLKETADRTPQYFKEMTSILMFLNSCFNSMEIELCREQVKRLVSLTMWSCLQPKRREQELKANPEWKKFWKKLQKREKPETKEKLDWERHFLQNLIIKFISLLETIPEDGEVNLDLVRYCERFIEFLVDLEALLPTRRFFNTVLDDCHVLVRCNLSNLAKREEGKLFTQISCHGVVWFVGWFAFCWMFDKPALYEIEVNILLGLIIDIVIVACLKAVTRRRRPVATDDPFAVGPDKFSFPSGHASRAFLVATFFIALSPLHFIFWGPLIAWASATALSRLLMYRHHVVDVICGCGLGVLEALLLGLFWIERDTAMSIMSWISDDRYLESGI